MSTLKKDNHAVKGQQQTAAGNKGGGATAQRAEGTNRKSDDADKQRKVASSAKGKADGRATGERGNDTKRPTSAKNR